MKKLLVILMLLPLACWSQRLNVRLDNEASAAINSQTKSQRVAGYRVCVFFDNSQTARGAASAALMQLRAASGVSAEVAYENPFFKVYAGYCLNRIEATKLLGGLKNIFPRAFIVGEMLPVSLFASVDSLSVTAVDDQLRDEL